LAARETGDDSGEVEMNVATSESDKQQFCRSIYPLGAASAMSHVLSLARQEYHLESIVHETLDNFSMAWRLVDLLITYKASNLPPPTATVLLRGAGPPADIPGTNCGFFAIPVINMAILDCRRSLEFFGLTCDHKTNRLTPIRGRRTDDLRIENFGLALVTPAQFLGVASKVVSVPLEPILIQVHNWSNKQLAHFTISQPTITHQSIRNMSVGMIEAYMQFLFEALGRPRPSINPSPT
jgi:hypothetical protein